jgi:hypothetical protein
MKIKNFCDVNGQTTFEKIADGNFYLTTMVIWSLGEYGRKQGGALSKKIRIRGGKVENFILTDNQQPKFFKRS